MRLRRGFTLLEMIVATLIVATAVVGLLSAISGTTRNAARLRDYDRVAQLARRQMNDLLSDYSLPRSIVTSGAFDPLQTGGLEIGWRARLSDFEMPPAPAPGQFALDRIELEVWWMSGAERRSFTLEGFRRRMLTARDLGTGAAP